MEQTILSENKKKRHDMPLWMLVFFAMFMFWQMGFIYFVGPALTIDGKTPLPVDMDNASLLIVLCYVLGILWMIFLPGTVVWTQRIATAAALAAAVGLFLPLSGEALCFLVYVQIFCCCLMIGFETFVIVNYFSERSGIRHLTFAYGVACLLIAFLQNDLRPVSFSAFRFAMVAALLLLLIFFIRLPARRGSLPRYVKKSDGLTAPKKLMFGAYILVFICALMGVSGPAISGEFRHGVFISYFADALVGFGLYLLYKKAEIHPFRLVPVLVGLGGLGFLLMLAAEQVPALTYAACALIGVGMVACQMLPLYGAVIMKSYPSRYIPPVIIALALGAVVVQGTLVEAFRLAPAMLYLVYAVIMAVLVIFYMQIEPFFLFTLRRRSTDHNDTLDAGRPSADAPLPKEREDGQDPLNALTPKEREVAELICMGYTNGDIARLLFISEHTVKDHTKKIYPKMGVHSRFELAALVSRQRSAERE